MNTSYKSRAWHFLRALTYAHDVAASEHLRYMIDQCNVWAREMSKCARNAFAPSGSEILTPSASYLAMEAAYAHEPYQPVYPI